MMMSKHLAAVLINNTELHLVLVALEHTSNCSWLSLAQLGNYSCSSQNIIGDCMLIVHKPLQTCIIWCMIVQPQKIKSCKWFYISETFRQKWCCSRKHLQAIVSPLLLYTTIWYVGLQPLYMQRWQDIYLMQVTVQHSSMKNPLIIYSML